MMKFAKLWDPDSFPAEFVEVKNDEGEVIGKKPVKHYRPIEGFLSNQAECVGRIFQRVQAGQMVEVFGDFVSEADQLSDTEMMDQFDFLDLQEDMVFEVKEQRKRAGAKKDQKPPQGGDNPPPPNPE